MVKICFDHSRSKLYGEAVKLAKRMPGYKNGGLHVIECESLDLFENWQTFSALYSIVSKWTGFKVFIDGRQLTPNAGVFFYAMQEIGYCHKQAKYHSCRLDVNRPGWGCGKLNRIKRHIEYASYAYWYQFGRFTPDLSGWIVDKQMLTDRLLSDAREMFLGECPLFNAEKIRMAVQALPDILNLENQNWQIVYRQDFVGDRIGKIPDGITHVIPENIPAVEWLDQDLENETQKTIDQMSDDEINRFIDDNLRAKQGKQNSDRLQKD